MERADHLDNLPMTPLEEACKRCLMSRPDVRDHILSSQELTKYILWMAQTYRRPADITFSDLPLHPSGQNISALVERIVADPADTQAQDVLSSNYNRQSEERYILADHDISVGRMLRYMPSHWHTNTYFEIYYAFSGTCPIHFQNEVIELKPGSVLIVAPSAVHASPCFSDNSVLVYYMVRTSTFQQVFWNHLPPDSLMRGFFRQALSGHHTSSYLHFETDNDVDIRRLLFQIYQEYNRDAPYEAQLLNALMSTFFVLLLRRYEGTARLPRTDDFFWKHQFSAILSHIQMHYATVTLEELAQKFHYSQKQISRIVQNCMGISYSQLILKLRMEKAAALLRQKVSIETVSCAVGYATISSFYRAFTKYYQITPQKYRIEQVPTDHSHQPC